MLGDYRRRVGIIAFVFGFQGGYLAYWPMRRPIVTAFYGLCWKRDLKGDIFI